MAISTIDGLINQEYFQKHLLAHLNEGMRVAAEPVIQRALKDVEAAMRAKLGAMVVSYLDGHLEVDRMGAAMRIIVRNDHGEQCAK